MAFFQTLGPGMVVMLADTEAGSIITAAQSGAVWGYKLLWAQLILVPVLYMTQALTVRLGICTGMGHATLILRHFGKFWAWFSVITLLIGCFGAIVSELSGLVGVGALLNISPEWMVGLSILTLMLIACTGSYARVERCALILGACEIVFIIVAFYAKPSLGDMVHDTRHIPWKESSYLYLLASNIGAVLMPWMVFYQQSAILDKKIPISQLKNAKLDTWLGACLTQIIMAAVLIATASTIGKTNPGASLNTIQDISHALTPMLGPYAAKLWFGMGMLGASLLACIVVSLTAAWSLGELMNYRASLSDGIREAPCFYGIYFLTLLIGGAVVLCEKMDLVALSVGVQILNAILLPVVIGFLFLLSCRALPPEHRLSGLSRYITGFVLFSTSVFGLYSAGAGLLGHVP